MSSVADYLRTHIVPAMLLSLVILVGLYFVNVNGVSFSKRRKHLDKEVVIRKETSTLI